MLKNKNVLYYNILPPQKKTTFEPSKTAKKFRKVAKSSTVLKMGR